MMKKLKNIPVFKSEEEERKFWASHDSSEYVDWGNAKRGVFPNLKPSTKTISLRLPEHILDEIKMLARKRDVPYQSLIKIFLKDRLNEELRHSG
ncbi:BrnA antitoxin family protein [Mariniphaga sediminis]|jgi:predicted DNA binding CopG/RHH family protein|uniref:BrnA antitoxin family protein n=1 Tax=Mariniphaga sediminis TaxID=1628158 RepID=UPI00356268DB